MYVQSIQLALAHIWLSKPHTDRLLPGIDVEQTLQRRSLWKNQGLYVGTYFLFLPKPIQYGSNVVSQSIMLAKLPIPLAST